MIWSTFISGIKGIVVSNLHKVAIQELFVKHNKCNKNESAYCDETFPGLEMIVVTKYQCCAFPLVLLTYSLCCELGSLTRSETNASCCFIKYFEMLNEIKAKIVKSSLSSMIWQK